MNFTIGQQHRIDFSVNVMGTSAEPTVRLIIETTPEISFPCYEANGKWVSTVFVPANLQAGTYKLRVEVVLNNRLFTPFSKPVEIVKPAVEAETVATLPQPEIAPKPPAELELPLAQVAPPVEMEIEIPPAVEEVSPPTPPVVDVKAIFRGEEVKPEPEAPKKITLPADFFKFTPKKVEKVEINLPPLGESLKRIKVEGTAQRIKLDETKRGGTPVSLTKGEIVYE